MIQHKARLASVRLLTLVAPMLLLPTTACCRTLKPRPPVLKPGPNDHIPWGIYPTPVAAMVRNLEDREGACKPLEGKNGAWTGRTVISSLRPDKTDDAIAVCRYEWQPKDRGGSAPKRARPDFGALDRPGSRVALDYPTMASAAPHPEFDQQDAEALHKRFLELADVRAANAVENVRVAVVDGSRRPYGSTGVEANPHAHAVGRVVAEIACGPMTPAESHRKDCDQVIQNYLALPMSGAEEAPPTAPGPEEGVFGTFGSLAAAIDEAVDAWAKPGDGGQRGPLVINLSLGWDPKHHELLLERKLEALLVRIAAGDESAQKDLATVWRQLQALKGRQDDVPPRAPRSKDGRGLPEAQLRNAQLVPELLWATVQESVMRATCAGALVVAAAGNGFALVDEGPMLPGGWETVRAPDENTCAPLLNGIQPRINDGNKGTYRPLVFAVGGLGYGDAPLANSRAHAMPRLAAYGLGLSMPDFRAPGYTPPLSGTSMSAASVSGAAARVWAAHPELDGPAIMQLLHDAGEPLLRHNPDFCLTSDDPNCNAQPVRRISVQCALSLAAGHACKPTIGYGAGTAPDVTPPSKSDPPEDSAQPVPMPNPMVYMGIGVAPWVMPQPPPFGCLPGLCAVQKSTWPGPIASGTLSQSAGGITLSPWIYIVADNAIVTWLPVTRTNPAPQLFSYVPLPLSAVNVSNMFIVTPPVGYSFWYVEPMVVLP